ncbi:hypothetical protein ACOMHN_024707 [Nucella lapillus]
MKSGKLRHPAYRTADREGHLEIGLADSGSRHFRSRLKLAKSTLVLIPLFGVHYIVFLGLPKDVDERTELVKLYFEMFFNSIQGFFVALLFCFLNGEVQSEVRKTWARFRLNHQRTFSRESCRSRTAGGSTYTSYLSRARESIGSFQHVQDLRGKPDGWPCSYTAVLDETPLASLGESSAERQPVPNGKGVHITGLEIQPMLNHVSSTNEAECPEDGGNDVARDNIRVN